MLTHWNLMQWRVNWSTGHFSNINKVHTLSGRVGIWTQAVCPVNCPASNPSSQSPSDWPWDHKPPISRHSVIAQNPVPSTGSYFIFLNFMIYIWSIKHVLIYIQIMKRLLKTRKLAYHSSHMVSYPFLFWGEQKYLQLLLAKALSLIK